MGLLFHSLCWDRKRIYMTLEKRKRWIVAFLDKAERELPEGQKQDVWWESFCPCFWGESGAFQDCNCSVISRIASLKYRPATCEEFYQTHIPFPYEKCLGKAVFRSLFCKSSMNSWYLKQELMYRSSVASLDGLLPSAGTSVDVVEMLWFFGLSEVGLKVHKKQQGNCWGSCAVLC